MSNFLKVKVGDILIYKGPQLLDDSKGPWIIEKNHQDLNYVIMKNINTNRTNGKYLRGNFTSDIWEFDISSKNEQKLKKALGL